MKKEYSLQTAPCQYSVQNETHGKTAYRGNPKGQDSPLGTFGFPSNGEQRGGAGPMHQGKGTGAKSGFQGPSVQDKKLL